MRPDVCDTKQENACRYLDEILARSSCASTSSRVLVAGPDFVKTGDQVSNLEDHRVNRTAAIGTPYLLETNIKLLPDDNIPNCRAAADLLENEKNRAGLIGEDAMLHYQQCSLSCAVDGNTATAFRSPYSELEGRTLEYFLNGPHRCQTRGLHSR